MNSSTLPRLLVPRAVYTEMVSQAVAEAPLECCGFLAGPAFAEGQGTVAARYPLVNAAASRTEYDADPKSLFAATKDIRNRGWEVLAVYHSHPTSPPVPSRTDLARAYWAGVVHFIISLQSSQPEVRGWCLSQEDYHEAEWEILNGPELLLAGPLPPHPRIN